MDPIIEYNMAIMSINCHTELEDLINVAYSVVWLINAGYGNTWVSDSGTQELDVTEIDPENFTAFEDLTQAQVKEWVINSMGVKYDELIAKLTERLETLKNPPTKSMTPPWMQYKPLTPPNQ